MNFGKFLYKKLHELDRSQEWLYRRAKLTTGSVQRWSRGQDPSTETFLKICSVLARETNKKSIQIVEEYLVFRK